MQVHEDPAKAARCQVQQGAFSRLLLNQFSTKLSPSGKMRLYHLTHFTYKKPKAPVLELSPQAHINGKGKRNSSPGHLILSQKCLSTATGHLPNSLRKFNHCLPTLATPASELINLLCISSRGGGGGWVAGEANLFTASVSPRGTSSGTSWPSHRMEYWDLAWPPVCVSDCMPEPSLGAKFVDKSIFLFESLQ